MGPLPVHASVDSPKPRRQAALRPFSEVRRREPAVVCQQPPVVGSTQLGGHRQSRPRSRRDYRNRGQAIARRRRGWRALRRHCNRPGPCQREDKSSRADSRTRTPALGRIRSRATARIGPDPDDSYVAFAIVRRPLPREGKRSSRCLAHRDRVPSKAITPGIALTLLRLGESDSGRDWPGR